MHTSIELHSPVELLAYTCHEKVLFFLSYWYYYTRVHTAVVVAVSIRFSCGVAVLLSVENNSFACIVYSYWPRVLLSHMMMPTCSYSVLYLISNHVLAQQ